MNYDYVSKDDLWDELQAVKERAEVREAELTARLAAVEAENGEFAEALNAAYTENQNLHCSTTISPKNGWDALERQTVILRQALSRRAERLKGGGTTTSPHESLPQGL